MFDVCNINDVVEDDVASPDIRMRRLSVEVNHFSSHFYSRKRLISASNFFVTPVEHFRDASYYKIFTNYTNSYVGSYDHKPTP